MEPPILARLLATLCLDSLPRTGWIQAGVQAPESIAAHSFGTALLALQLADEVAPALDVDRCVALCVAHDVPEALTGDLPRLAGQLLPKGAKRAAERAAGERLLDGTALERLREYTEGATREARFARLCDRLHLGLRGYGYLRAGCRGLDEFRDTLEAVDASEFEPLRAVRDALLSAWVPEGGGGR